MAANSTTTPPEEGLDMQAAAALVLQRDELRQRKARKREKQRRQEERESIQKMHHSIEVIKWCIVAICTVWLISFIISIVVLIKVQAKVAVIEGDVQRIRHVAAEIEGDVERVRHVMDNPFASAGARLGGDVDEKLKKFFKLPDLQDGKE